MHIIEIIKLISEGKISQDDIYDKSITLTEYKYIKANELFSVAKIIQLTNDCRTFWWKVEEVHYDRLCWKTCFSTIYLSEYNEICTLKFYVEIKRRKNSNKVRDYVFELFDEKTQQISCLGNSRGVKLYDELFCYMKKTNESFMQEYYVNTLWGKLKRHSVSWKDLDYFICLENKWNRGVKEEYKEYIQYLNKECEIVGMQKYCDDTGFVLTLISVVAPEYFIPKIVSAIVVSTSEMQVVVNYSDQSEKYFNYGYSPNKRVSGNVSRELPKCWYFPEVIRKGYDSSKDLLDIPFELDEMKHIL